MRGLLSRRGLLGAGLALPILGPTSARAQFDVGPFSRPGRPRQFISRGERGTLFDLGVLPPADNFTQVGVSGSVSVIENPGRAITLLNTSPPVDSGHFLSVMKVPVPPAPYRIAIFLLVDGVANQYLSGGAGFTDGTKFDNVSCILNGGAVWEHETYSNNTTRASVTNIGTNVAPTSPGMWIGLRDTGAGHVLWETSQTGAFWTTVLDVTKSTGYLGSSGYTSCYFGCQWDANSPSGVQQAVTCLCWDPNGLNRSAG